MDKVISVDCSKCENKSKSVFCDLTDRALNDLSHNKNVNCYKKGEVVFYQGNPPTGLYCINRGKVKILKAGNEGKESIVRIAGPGDVLGHRSLFSKENYTATATALEETVICLIEKDYIFKVLKNETSIALNLIEKLGKEMGAAESKIASMFQKNVSERLAEFLLTLLKNYGIEENGRYRLDIKLTREEIAQIIGTTNETVIRFISDFKEQAVIEQDGKTLYVVDKKRLLKFANLSC